MSESDTKSIGDAPQYNSCSRLIQVMTTGPLPAPSKSKSGLPRITGTCPGWWKKVSGYGYCLWCGFRWGPHHVTSHLRSQLESQHQSVPGCAEECGDTLVQSSGRWQSLGVAAGLGASPKVQRDPGLAFGVLRLCTLLPFFPDQNPLEYFVSSYVENITNIISHNTKASLITAIHRVFADLPPALAEKACSQFRIRIEAVIESESSYIE